jgi:hypothetical protein
MTNKSSGETLDFSSFLGKIARAVGDEKKV